MLKAHVLNRLMTGRWPRKSLQLRPSQNSFNFQKCYIERTYINRHLDCTDVSFNPKTAPSPKLKVTHRQTDRQSDYCNPLAHARRGLNMWTTNPVNYREYSLIKTPSDVLLTAEYTQCYLHCQLYLSTKLFQFLGRSCRISITQFYQTEVAQLA